MPPQYDLGLHVILQLPSKLLLDHTLLDADRSILNEEDKAVPRVLHKAVPNATFCGLD